MQIARRDRTYCVHSPYNEPQITVKPGEIFLAETELCTGAWLFAKEDTWAPEKTASGPNPTVVAAIEGAKPGDMLAVDIVDITPDKLGYTGFCIQSNPLADLISPRSWGLNVKTVAIGPKWIEWSDKVKLPVRPMIGTLGTAPAGEALSNAKGGVHGGNMDVQEVCTGSTVYLPVEVDGALLHIGDVHACQGDGEINCSGGIECRSVVRLRVNIMQRPEDFQCVRIENDEYWMTVACERSLEESFYVAAGQLLTWVSEETGLDEKEVYLLMGQLMEARATQFVNPTRSYICKMPKPLLVKEECTHETIQ